MKKELSEDEGLLKLTGKVLKSEISLTPTESQSQKFVEIPIYP